MKKRSSKATQPVKSPPPAPKIYSAGTTFAALLLLTLGVAILAAVTLERNKVYRTGISVWQSMVNGSPKKRRTHENYGQALSTAGMLHEALHEFQTVLSLPDDGSVPLRDVYREIGVVYFRLGSYEESIKSWRMGLMYAPLDPGLMNNIAIALLKLNRYDEAVSHAEAAVRSNPVMPEPVNTLGEIYMAQGKHLKATEYFKRYLYLRPEDARGYWNIALALTRGGHYDEAYQYATRFTSSGLSPRELASGQELLNFINDARKKRK